MGGQYILICGSKDGQDSHKYCSIFWNDIKYQRIYMPRTCKFIRNTEGFISRDNLWYFLPPPTYSVARQVEWILVKGFDIYWLFSESVDQYQGQILAGMDPNSSTFNALLNHVLRVL